MSWRAVLQGADADAARAAIARLAVQVAADPLDDPTLIRGAAGAALLHGTLARGGDEQAAERAHAALGRALERIGEVAPGPWLGTGFVGVAWVMNHLADVLPIDDDALAPIDEMVADLLRRPEWPHEYELWQGLVGVGVYARARGRGDLVARAVAHLDRLAERSEAGATWWNRDFFDFGALGADPRGYHNLGFALGVAGVIAFLADAASDGITAARPLLAEATRWLLAHDRPHMAPRFPGAIGMAIPAEKLRNGWCYGDLPVAIAAVRAGTVLGEPGWIAHGRDIARAMAAGPVEDVPDFDVAFCHGAAGRAHMFNRLGQALRDDELLAAAHLYYRETLVRLSVQRTLPPHLNVGACGVALVLMGAVSASEPTWDSLLLAAIPPA
ncbi:MAG: lanthionine synthetase C family protein [Deltaproteobacteria bacterium]|nr:lanthionine synthetase C family protein [Deltaproteobacteria bacterium]